MVFGPGSKDHKSINSILPEGLLSNLEYLKLNLDRCGQRASVILDTHCCRYWAAGVDAQLFSISRSMSQGYQLLRCYRKPDRKSIPEIC